MTKRFPIRDCFGESEITSLEGVEIGDKFMRLEKVGFTATRYIIVECTKLTPKQALIGNKRYWIKNASVVGEYYGNRLMPIDEAKIQQSKRESILRKKRRELGEVNWDKETDELVEKIHDLWKEGKEKPCSPPTT